MDIKLPQFCIKQMKSYLILFIMSSNCLSCLSPRLLELPSLCGMSLLVWHLWGRRELLAKTVT